MFFLQYRWRLIKIWRLARSLVLNDIVWFLFTKRLSKDLLWHQHVGDFKRHAATLFFAFQLVAMVDFWALALGIQKAASALRSFLIFFLIVFTLWTFISSIFFLRMIECTFCARCVIALRALRFASLRWLRKEKGESRGENDHGSFPLLSWGQMSAAGVLTIRASRAVDRVFNKIIEII